MLTPTNMSVLDQVPMDAYKPSPYEQTLCESLFGDPEIIEKKDASGETKTPTSAFSFPSIRESLLVVSLLLLNESMILPMLIRLMIPTATESVVVLLRLAIIFILFVLMKYVVAP
jgi:hypothetical protein